MLTTFRHVCNVLYTGVKVLSNEDISLKLSKHLHSLQKKPQSEISVFPPLALSKTL